MNGGESMNDQMKSKVAEVLEHQHGIARTRDFLNAGISHHYIRELESQCEIIRLKHGLYRQVNPSNTQVNELIEVSKLVPNGVICLLFSQTGFKARPTKIH